MKITIISLFPEMLAPTLEQSMLYQAQKKGIVEFRYVNLREFGIGSRKQVDDIVYGGGDGMLLRPEPLVESIEYAHKVSRNPRVILMGPRGKRFVQKRAEELATSAHDLIFVCARYEGYDERVVKYVDEVISIGDFVLTGGELPAMSVIDAVVRLLPGVLGGETSAQLESFADGKTKEHPHFTRPNDFRGDKVPDVLLSGNHADIEAWRRKNSKQD